MEQRELALITGASMGIGKELATLFAADGRDLVLVARSEEKLKALGTELEKAHDMTAGNDTSILFKLSVSPADKVARHAYRSMMKGKVVAIEGLLNSLMAFSVRFSPRALVRKLARWMNKTT
jgi:short-subunit dehydrogenase